MQKKLREEQKKKIYTTMLEYPAKTDYEIGQMTGYSRSTVWKIRRSLVGAIEYEMAQKVAGKFLSEFQMASDYFKLQIERLEEQSKSIESFLDGGTKTVFHKAKEGHSYSEDVPLNEFDRLAIFKEMRDIEKQKTELWKNILELARQGEAVEVMRLIHSGKLKPMVEGESRCLKE